MSYRSQPDECFRPRQVSTRGQPRVRADDARRRSWSAARFTQQDGARELRFQDDPYLAHVVVYGDLRRDGQTTGAMSH